MFTVFILCKWTHTVQIMLFKGQLYSNSYDDYSSHDKLISQHSGSNGIIMSLGNVSPDLSNGSVLSVLT